MSRKTGISALILLLPLAGFLACNTSINSAIVVADGQKRQGSLNTVNGPIEIGEDCEVGGCRSVNGALEVGNGSQVERLSTVNGSIRAGQRVIVTANVESVNGSITLGRETNVAGDVSAVNGRIKLSATQVAEDIHTVNGDVMLREGSVVHGDIIVESKGDERRKRPLEIEIADGSTVMGDIRVERDVPVQVILRSGGKVQGTIENAEIIDENDAVDEPVAQG